MGDRVHRSLDRVAGSQALVLGSQGANETRYSGHLRSVQMLGLAKPLNAPLIGGTTRSSAGPCFRRCGARAHWAAASSSALLFFVPKCPACVAAYLAAAGIGVNAVFLDAIVPSVWLAFIAACAWQVRASLAAMDAVPAALGVGAMMAATTGRITHSSTVSLIGIALFACTVALHYLRRWNRGRR